MAKLLGDAQVTKHEIGIERLIFVVSLRNRVSIRRCIRVKHEERDVDDTEDEEQYCESLHHLKVENGALSQVDGGIWKSLIRVFVVIV